MIRTTMVLDTLGLGVKLATLVEIDIINDGTGTATRGNYTYQVRGRRGRILKIGKLTNWPRQAKTACALLQAVINDAYPKGVGKCP